MQSWLSTMWLSHVIAYNHNLRPGSMFYYHNPLTFPSGAPRLPSLELPFSSTQPCEHHDDEQDDDDHDCYRDDDSWTTYRFTVPTRPGNDLPLWSTRWSVPSKKTAEKQNYVLSATVGGEDDQDDHKWWSWWTWWSWTSPLDMLKTYYIQLTIWLGFILVFD